MFSIKCSESMLVIPAVPKQLWPCNTVWGIGPVHHHTDTQETYKLTFLWLWHYYFCMCSILHMCIVNDWISRTARISPIKFAPVFIRFFMHRLFCSTTFSIPIKIHSLETIITFLNHVSGQIVKILFHGRQSSIYPVVWFVNNMTWTCKEHVTDYVEYEGPCLPWGNFSKTCTTSLSQNRKKYIYIFTCFMEVIKTVKFTGTTQLICFIISMNLLASQIITYIIIVMNITKAE